MTKGIDSFHQRHIRGTAPHSVVASASLLVSSLDAPLLDIISLGHSGSFHTSAEIPIYLHSRALKHLYDKRPAEEYDFLLSHFTQLLRRPDWIYKNRDFQRGDVCFATEIQTELYLCSLEYDGNALYIVTAMRVRRISYLDSYTLLWSRKGGGPSSQYSDSR